MFFGIAYSFLMEGNLKNVGKGANEDVGSKNKAARIFDVLIYFKFSGLSIFTVS